jgi:hypothetical protein
VRKLLSGCGKARQNSKSLEYEALREDSCGFSRRIVCCGPSFWPGSARRTRDLQTETHSQSVHCWESPSWVGCGCIYHSYCSHFTPTNRPIIIIFSTHSLSIGVSFCSDVPSHLPPGVVACHLICSCTSAAKSFFAYCLCKRSEFSDYLISANHLFLDF